jgi:hypothetical protein
VFQREDSEGDVEIEKEESLRGSRKREGEEKRVERKKCEGRVSLMLRTNLSVTIISLIHKF